MTVFTSQDSKPVPPGTPPPSPPPGGPRHPEPTAPPPRDSANGPRPDTTRPVPTPRPAPGPGRLDRFDRLDVDALTHALFHDRPADPSAAATIAAARVKYDAGVRMMASALMDVAVAYGIETPARRMQTSAPSGVPAEPPAGSEGGRAGGSAATVLAPGAVEGSRLVSDGPAPGSVAHGGAAWAGPGAGFDLPRIERRAGESRPYSRIGLAGQQVGTAVYRNGVR